MQLYFGLNYTNTQNCKTGREGEQFANLENQSAEDRILLYVSFAEADHWYG
jgi:hypothetical protein